MHDEAAEPTRVLQRPLEAPERTRHAESPADWVGVATDIGRRHRTNQDAYAVAVADDTAVLVISDGVSSSIGAERASITAATAVRAELLAAADDAEPAWDERFLQAYTRAQREVLDIGTSGAPVGSCTLIAAVVQGREIHLGNIGDTRAYWVADAHPEAHQLSVDDSLAQAQMDLGVSREAAETGAYAHAITRWIGPDAPDLAPRMYHFRAETPGIVVVCSDGLWNYASAPAAMAELVRSILAEVQESSPEAGHLRELARRLADWANQRGGRDNITVAIARIT